MTPSLSCRLVAEFFKKAKERSPGSDHLTDDRVQLTLWPPMAKLAVELAPGAINPEESSGGLIRAGLPALSRPPPAHRYVTIDINALCRRHLGSAEVFRCCLGLSES